MQQNRQIHSGPPPSSATSIPERSKIVIKAGEGNFHVLGHPGCLVSAETQVTVEENQKSLVFSATVEFKGVTKPTYVQLFGDRRQKLEEISALLAAAKKVKASAATDLMPPPARKKRKKPKAKADMAARSKYLYLFNVERPNEKFRVEPWHLEKGKELFVIIDKAKVRVQRVDVADTEDWLVTKTRFTRYSKTHRSYWVPVDTPYWEEGNKYIAVLKNKDGKLSRTHIEVLHVAHKRQARDEVAMARGVDMAKKREETKALAADQDRRWQETITRAKKAAEIKERYGESIGAFFGGGHSSSSSAPPVARGFMPTAPLPYPASSSSASLPLDLLALVAVQTFSSTTIPSSSFSVGSMHMAPPFYAISSSSSSSFSSLPDSSSPPLIEEGRAKVISDRREEPGQPFGAAPASTCELPPKASHQHSVQRSSPHHFPLPPDSLPSSVISAPSPVASSSPSASVVPSLFPSVPLPSSSHPSLESSLFSLGSLIGRDFEGSPSPFSSVAALESTTAPLSHPVSSLSDSSYSPLIAGGANVINGRREPGLVLSENSMGPPAPKVKKRKRQELEKDPRSGGQSFREAPVSADLRHVGLSKPPKGLPPRRLKISQSLLPLGAAPASTYESPSKGLPSGRVAVPEPLRRLKIHRSLLLPDKWDFTDLTAEIAIDIFEHGQEPLILAGLPDGDRIIKPHDIYQEFAEEYVAHAMGDGATRLPMSLSSSTSSSQPPISAPQPSASRASLSLPSSLPGFASSGAVSRSAPQDLVAPSSPLRASSVFPIPRFNPPALPPLSLGDRMVSYDPPPSPSPYVIEPSRYNTPAIPAPVEAELGGWEESYDGEGAEALALGGPPR